MCAHTSQIEKVEALEKHYQVKLSNQSLNIKNIIRYVY